MLRSNQGSIRPRTLPFQPSARLPLGSQAAQHRGEYRQAAGSPDHYGIAVMARILRFALLALMAIASAVFIYGMVQEFNRLPPQSATTGQGNPSPR